MIGGASGLVAAYLLIVVLLLSLNLRSAWWWPVKAAAIGVAAAFFVVAFLALQALLGWPSEVAPPARFELHAARIDEPDKRQGGKGAIYLWLSAPPADGSAAPPRAHVLPYSRPLHEAVARMQGRLREGQRVAGRFDAAPAAPREPGVSVAPAITFYEAPAGLPPKTSARS